MIFHVIPASGVTENSTWAVLEVCFSLVKEFLKFIKMVKVTAMS